MMKTQFFLGVVAAEVPTDLDKTTHAVVKNQGLKVDLAYKGGFAAMIKTAKE